MQRIVQQLRIDHDRQNQVIWFSGALSDGYKFSVGFPIAHLQLTFDDHAASLGWAGPPMCGAVTTIDGFFSGIKALTNAKSQASQIVAQAHNTSMRTLATQAQHYGQSGASHVRAGNVLSAARVSHLLPAVSAQGLGALHAAHLVIGPRSTPAIRSQAAANVRRLQANATHPMSQLTLAALKSATT